MFHLELKVIISSYGNPTIQNETLGYVVFFLIGLFEKRETLKLLSVTWISRCNIIG